MQQDKLSPLDRQLVNCINTVLSKSKYDSLHKTIRHETGAIFEAIKMYNQQYISNMLGEILKDVEKVDAKELKEKLEQAKAHTAKIASMSLANFNKFIEKKESRIIKPFEA